MVYMQRSEDNFGELVLSPHLARAVPLLFQPLYIFEDDPLAFGRFSCLYFPSCRQSAEITDASCHIQVFVSSRDQMQVFRLVWEGLLPTESCCQPSVVALDSSQSPVGGTEGGRSRRTQHPIVPIALTQESVTQSPSRAHSMPVFFPGTNNIPLLSWAAFCLFVHPVGW